MSMTGLRIEQGQEWRDSETGASKAHWRESSVRHDWNSTKGLDLTEPFQLCSDSKSQNCPLEVPSFGYVALGELLT